MSKKLTDAFPSNDNQGNAAAKPKDPTIVDISVEDHLKNHAVDHLPQARILSDCLNHLASTEDISEAYLRGSFSSGTADKYSDIDLFLVVKPDNVEQTYKAFHDYMAQNTPVVFGCHDRLVTDYGGLGFMFLCQGQDGKLFQFDLYTAIEGVPPKVGLYDAPRVFSRDENYCWMDETQQTQPLPEHTQKFIEKYTEGLGSDEKMELLHKDLAVTLYVMSKHIKRGQNARSLNDNNHALGICVEMIEEIKGIDTYQTPLYAADAIIAQYKNDPDPQMRAAIQTLDECLLQTPDMSKVKKLFALGESLLDIACPHVRTNLQPSMDKFKQCAFRADDGSQKFATPRIAPKHG